MLNVIKKNSIYLICAAVSIMLLIIGCTVHLHELASSVLIGIGCSGLTASLMSLFIEIREARTRTQHLRNSRQVYFKGLYDEITMLLQRVLWFDERIHDHNFNWGLPSKEYSSFKYMIFSSQEYPSTNITYDEFKEKLACCEQKYSYSSLLNYSDDERQKIIKMFDVLCAGSSRLAGHTHLIYSNNVLLASQDYISLEGIELIRFNVFSAIGLMGNPMKNYAVAIRQLVQVFDLLQNNCGYDIPELTIALQGTISTAEL